MRVDLHKPVSARRGDTVAITASLPRDLTFARLYVWSAPPGMEMSPHVFTHQLLAIDEEGRPAMVRPFSIYLNEQRREFKAEFIADEDTDFVVRQDVDVADDTKAKARIKCYGKAATALRRRVRNAIRTLGNLASRRFWKEAAR